MTRPSVFAGVSTLVVGQGSIGQRHARILAEEGAEVATVSAAATGAFRSLDEAFAARTFAYIVIANETSLHIETMQRLAEAGYDGRLLVEKPLGAGYVPAGKLPSFSHAGVAYNLRFHPVIDALRHALRGREVVDVRMHVGQHLADWRPGTDYRTGYSAKLETGGGVLRDLSHELDLAQHLFGRWSRLTAIGGNRGVLDIESDEVWSILMQMESGASVTLTLNYFDRPAERVITVSTRDTTIRADVLGGALSVAGAMERFETDRDLTYRLQHAAMLADGGTLVCTVDEGVAVTRTIEAIERAGREKVWVEA